MIDISTSRSINDHCSLSSYEAKASMTKYNYFVISVILLMGVPIGIANASQPCTSTLQVNCNQNSVTGRYSYFGDRIPQDAQLMISCNPQPPEAWSLSISGNEDDAITVNTSLGRYVVSGNTLLLNNVNEMDEGLYRCVYHRSTVRHTCIYIYARAVFASCPYGCINEEPEAISATEGENITFNSSVVYISGGRCGFQQTINRLQLKSCGNVNNCNVPPLFEINTGQARTGHDGRISLSSGDFEGDLSYTFTLANAITTDSGLYEVKLRGVDPTPSGSDTCITKRFRVTVSVKETTTSLPTDRAATTATSITNDSLELVIGVSFAVLIGLVFCVLVVITVTVILARRCKKCKEDNKITVLDHDPESVAGALVPLGSRIISGQVVTKDGSLANLCMNPTESQTEDSRLHHSGDVAEPHIRLLHPSEYQQSKREGLRLDLSSRPAIPDLMRIVAPRTPNKWMQIGIQLGLPLNQLEAFECQYRGDSQKIFAGIFAYLEKQPVDEPMTWLTVINVLRAQGIDELALAHELETMFTSSMSSLQQSHAVLHP